MSNFSEIRNCFKEEMFKNKEGYKNIITALDCLDNAERNLYIDYSKSGPEIRQAIESFVYGVLKENGGYNKVVGKDGRTAQLSDYIYYLRCSGYLKGVEVFYENTRGEKIQKSTKDKKYPDRLDFLRLLANTYSHSENNNKNAPKRSYKNVKLALEQFYGLFVELLGKYNITADEKFSDEKIPIGDYITDEYKVPADKERSKCTAEIFAHSVDDRGNIQFYYIFRVYELKNVYEKHLNLLKRNITCFAKSTSDEVDGTVKGTVPIQEITTINPDNIVTDGHYIISYRFNKKPQVLGDDILQKMSLDDRLRISSKIAECLFRLQYNADEYKDVVTEIPAEEEKPSFKNLFGLIKKKNSAPEVITTREYKLKEYPIYHRMLNHESIYICDFDGKYMPYITKFDFAKIEGIGSTVKKVVHDAKLIIEDSKLFKYLPFEWIMLESFDEDVNIDLAKVDIFSLGVLISDILYGKIARKVVPISELPDEVPDEIKTLLSKMCQEDPYERPDILEVKKVFGF